MAGLDLQKLLGGITPKEAAEQLKNPKKRKKTKPHGEKRIPHEPRRFFELTTPPIKEPLRVGLDQIEEARHLPKVKQLENKIARKEAQIRSRSAIARFYFKLTQEV